MPLLYRNYRPIVAFIKCCYSHFFFFKGPIAAFYNATIGLYPIVAFLKCCYRPLYVFLKKLVIVVFQNPTIANNHQKKRKKRKKKRKNKCFQILKSNISILIKLRNTKQN